MKKVLFLLFTVISLGQNTYAQTLNPTWSIQTANSADSFKGGFTFAYATSGTPWNGSLISFGGFSNNYDTQINADYGPNGGNHISFRTANHDSGAGIWNPWVELATKGSNTFSGNQVVNGNISSSVSSNEGGFISLENPLKTANDVASTWRIYNMTGGNYGNSLQFWSYSQNGPSYGSKMTLSDNGNVGIGTQNPTSKLSVRGSITINSGLIGSSPRPAISASNLQDGEIRAHSGGSELADDGFTRISAGGGTNANAKSYIDLSGYSTVPDMDKNIVFGTSGNERLRINSNGNVGIGTQNPAHKLDVIGTIRAREVKVDLLGADFVFEDDYKLMPLNELEKFVKQNKHLPEIAPAKEMQENGSNLGSLTVQLLQKIEELTLHVIEQNKKIDLQNKEINLLKDNMKKVQKINKRYYL